MTIEIFSIRFSAHAEHKLLLRNRLSFLAFGGRRLVDFGTQCKATKKKKTKAYKNRNYWLLCCERHCSITDLPLPKHCWNTTALLDKDWNQFCKRVGRERGRQLPAAGETVKPRLSFWISLFWVLTLNYNSVSRGIETTELTKFDIDPRLRSPHADRLHFAAKWLKSKILTRKKVKRTSKL